MCHSFRRGTMQMYQIREANSGGKSKKVVVYIIQKGLNHYIPIIYKTILSSSTCQLSSLPVPTSRGHRQPCCEPSYDSYKWW